MIIAATCYNYRLTRVCVCVFVDICPIESYHSNLTPCVFSIASSRYADGSKSSSSFLRGTLAAFDPHPGMSESLDVS